VCDMDWAHILSVSKSRCSAVADMRMEKPGPGFMGPVLEWLDSGTARPAAAPIVANTAGLDGLLSLYSAEAIMAANGGQIPMTDAEVQATADILVGVAG